MQLRSSIVGLSAALVATFLLKYALRKFSAPLAEQFSKFQELLRKSLSALEASAQQKNETVLQP